MQSISAWFFSGWSPVWGDSPELGGGEHSGAQGTKCLAMIFKEQEGREFLLLLFILQEISPLPFQLITTGAGDFRSSWGSKSE